MLSSDIRSFDGDGCFVRKRWFDQFVSALRKKSSAAGVIRGVSVSGSLAMLAAIRRASSMVSNLVAIRRALPDVRQGRGFNLHLAFDFLDQNQR